MRFLPVHGVHDTSDVLDTVVHFITDDTFHQTICFQQCLNGTLHMAFEQSVLRRVETGQQRPVRAPIQKEAPIRPFAEGFSPVGARGGGMDSVFRRDLYERMNVLVTGGATGIGYGIAHAYAAHGAVVHIMSRNEERLKAATAEIGKAGKGGAHHHVADVRDTDRIQEVADEVGPLDVLVNAAAGNFPSPFSAMSDNAWESVIDIVLNGTATCTRAFGEPMKAAAEGDGTPRNILNIVAGYAWTGAPGVAHSGAAKAGVLNLTKSLAVEWAPHIRLNAVSPGPIDGTEGMKRLGDDLGLRDTVEGSVPLGRMGRAAEIADACLYLSSPGASYVTGACLPVDGGQDAVGPFGALFSAMRS